MNFLRIETKVPKDKKIVLDKLPFQVGESLEIIVLSGSENKSPYPPYTLRGKKIKYPDPTESVAVDDWEALR